MNGMTEAAESLDNTINQLDKLFNDGIAIKNIDSFRHHASAWYKLGYEVGKNEVAEMQIKKVKKGVVTVLEHKGRRYILDHQNNRGR